MMITLRLSSLLALAITPGKAYVKGFEIEKITQTFKDLTKQEIFKMLMLELHTYEIGNFAKITNLYNTPDIGAVSGETTAYKTLGLFDDVTSTRGSASGNQVGVARAGQCNMNLEQQVIQTQFTDYFYLT